MRLRVLIVLTLLATSLIMLSAAQTPDYSGKAKVVVKLTKMPEMPRAENTASFAETPATFGMPAVPRGAMLQGEVLYSGDPAIKKGQTYSLYINYDPDSAPPGFQGGLADKLKSGAVVGINDYTVQGNQITVNVGTAADWKSKVFIVDMQYTDPGEARNPFMINLDGFRQFNALPPLNHSAGFKPMFSMPDWTTGQLSGPHSLFGGMFSRLFG